MFGKQKLTHRYDMSNKKCREQTVQDIFTYAMARRKPQEERWNECYRYYNNEHYTKQQISELAAKFGWDFVPPVLPDPFIQVESQVNDVVPTFQFKGKDGDLDPLKAKVREDIVNHILYTNDIDIQNLESDRVRLITGDSFYKVAYDGSTIEGNQIGKIVIGNPHVTNIFPDPSAFCIDDCEYVIYAYQMHWLKARRKWGKILEEIGTDNKHYETRLENDESTYDDDTLQIIEYWYRDEEGDVACSIQAGGKEVQHIKKYWEKTRFSGNKMFPIVQLYNIPISQSFWNRGEIEGIIDLTEAGNRELMSALLNDMFNGADIIIADEGAMKEDKDYTMTPGAVWEKSQGKNIDRLGSSANNANAVNMTQFIHDKIQETNGNFATKGKEPARVTTASGLAQLREDRNERALVKGAGRLFGYKQLAKLIDWTALEFYDTERIITIRGKTEDEADKVIKYNSEELRIKKEKPLSFIKDEDEQDEYYYPQVDVEISAGSGIQKSKVMTLSVIERLLNIAITPQNATFVKMYIDTLDIPNKKDIKNEIDNIIAEMKQMMQQPQSADIDQQADDILSSLTEEEQAAFLNMNEEEQIELLQSTMG